MGGRHRLTNSSPEHLFSVEHATAVRETALRIVESSEALLTLLDEDIEESIDVTGSLARLQDQLNALLGGDKERRLRAKMGVTREAVVAKPLSQDEYQVLLPDDYQEEPQSEVTESALAEGQTSEHISSEKLGPKKERARKERNERSLSRRGIARQELRAYYAELAALKRLQRERRELKKLMSEHPFKTNSTRDEAVFLTHGAPAPRAKK